MFSLGSRCVGISALNRLGFNGVTTMKMISTTNSTSINGVTLMYGTARLRPPALVAINLPSVQRLASVSTRARCSGFVPGSGCRGRHSRALLQLVGDQPYFIYALLAHGVDYFHDFTVTNFDAALDVDDLVLFLLVCQRFLNLTLEVIEVELLLAEIILAVLRDRDDDRTFFVNPLVFVGVFHAPRNRDVDALLQKRRDHHKDDQEYQHHVHHRRDVDLRLQTATTASLHAHKSNSFSW